MILDESVSLQAYRPTGLQVYRTVHPIVRDCIAVSGGGEAMLRRDGMLQCLACLAAHTWG